MLQVRLGCSECGPRADSESDWNLLSPGIEPILSQIGMFRIRASSRFWVRLGCSGSGPRAASGHPRRRFRGARTYCTTSSSTGSGEMPSTGFSGTRSKAARRRSTALALRAMVLRVSACRAMDFSVLCFELFASPHLITRLKTCKQSRTLAWVRFERSGRFSVKLECSESGPRADSESDWSALNLGLGPL